MQRRPGNNGNNHSNKDQGWLCHLHPVPFPSLPGKWLPLMHLLLNPLQVPQELGTEAELLLRHIPLLAPDRQLVSSPRGRSKVLAWVASGTPGRCPARLAAPRSLSRREVLRPPKCQPRSKMQDPRGLLRLLS